MHKQYIHSYANNFLHKNANIREYKPSLKTDILKPITINRLHSTHSNNNMPYRDAIHFGTILYVWMQTAITRVEDTL